MRTSLVVREVFLMKPVVMMRAWIWFTCSVVVHFGRSMSVGIVEAHGWCEEELAHTTSINGIEFFELFWQQNGCVCVVQSLLCLVHSSIGLREALARTGTRVISEECFFASHLDKVIFVSRDWSRCPLFFIIIFFGFFIFSGESHSHLLRYPFFGLGSLLLYQFHHPCENWHEKNGTKLGGR